MEDDSYKEKPNPVQFVHDYMEALHALPEPQRRFFGVVTMLIATLGVGMASWFLFPALQSLNLPSINDGTHLSDAQGGENRLIDDAQLADASKIPQIGPISGFVDSFNAVKDLLVSKDLQAIAQVNTTETWTGILSQWLGEFAAKAKIFSLSILDQTKMILNYLAKQALMYVPDFLNKLISLTSRVSQ